MAGYDLPLRAVRQQVTSALDLIIQLERMHDGSRKVTSITEVQRMESDVITLQDLYTFEIDSGGSTMQAVMGSLKSSGIRPLFVEKFARRGVKLPGSVAPVALAPMHGPPIAARGAGR